jgi:hypothetical protein
MNAKEIVHWHFHTWGFLSVPVDPQDEIAIGGRIRGRIRAVKVPDASWALQVGNHTAFALADGRTTQHTLRPVLLGQLQPVLD